MIRIATEYDFSSLPDDECALRIHSLKRSYGLDVPFVRYYADGHGGLLSVMDGIGVLYCREITEEWLLFITMNPDVSRLHCSADVSSYFTSIGWQGRTGVVMKYDGPDVSVSPKVCETPYLPSVHKLLSECFEELPSLNAWYPDVSHRIRHHCAQIACVLDREAVVSTAMTVAETDAAALLGQVATHPDCRGNGYAKTCINSLVFRCKDKTLYILPKNDFAQKLYEHMGFVPCGQWAELYRT